MSRILISLLVATVAAAGAKAADTKHAAVDSCADHEQLDDQSCHMQSGLQATMRPSAPPDAARERQCVSECATKRTTRQILTAKTAKPNQGHKFCTGGLSYDYVVIGGGPGGTGAARALADLNPSDTVGMFVTGCNFSQDLRYKPSHTNTKYYRGSMSETYEAQWGSQPGAYRYGCTHTFPGMEGYMGWTYTAGLGGTMNHNGQVYSMGTAHEFSLDTDGAFTIDDLRAIAKYIGWNSYTSYSGNSSLAYDIGHNSGIHPHLGASFENMYQNAGVGGFVWSASCASNDGDTRRCRMAAAADGIFGFYSEDARRESTYYAMIQEPKTAGRLQNLDIHLGWTAQRVLMDDDVAVGVELDDENQEVQNVAVRKAVILSAGAFASPQIVGNSLDKWKSAIASDETCWADHVGMFGIDYPMWMQAYGGWNQGPNGGHHINFQDRIDSYCAGTPLHHEGTLIVRMEAFFNISEADYAYLLSKDPDAQVIHEWVGNHNVEGPSLHECELGITCRRELVHAWCYNLKPKTCGKFGWRKLPNHRYDTLTQAFLIPSAATTFDRFASLSAVISLRMIMARGNIIVGDGFSINGKKLEEAEAWLLQQSDAGAMGGFYGEGNHHSKTLAHLMDRRTRRIKGTTNLYIGDPSAIGTMPTGHTAMVSGVQGALAAVAASKIGVPAEWGTYHKVVKNLPGEFSEYPPACVHENSRDRRCDLLAPRPPKAAPKCDAQRAHTWTNGVYPHGVYPVYTGSGPKSFGLTPAGELNVVGTTGGFKWYGTWNLKQPPYDPCGEMTMAEVAKHNTAKDCFILYRLMPYEGAYCRYWALNATGLMHWHFGGSSTIETFCGAEYEYDVGKFHMTKARGAHPKFGTEPHDHIFFLGADYYYVPDSPEDEADCPLK